MILFLLAAAGSGLVLTQSSIVAPLRDGLARIAADAEQDGERRARLYRLAAKLVACPMCAGFWLGFVWGWALFGVSRTLPAYGFAGSFASAIGTAAWLYLDNATPWAPPEPRGPA